MNPSTIEGAVASGASSLFTISPIVTILVLAIIVLCWFIKSLMKDLKELQNKTTDALIANTAVNASMQEMVRAALNK